MIPMPALVTERLCENLNLCAGGEPRGLRLRSLALVLGGSAGRYESPQERGILALMESPGKHIESRRCVPAGQRNRRAGLRRPVVCVAQYAEGSAMWHRDV